MVDGGDDSLFSMVYMMIEEEVDRVASRFSLPTGLKDELCMLMKQRSTTFTEDMKSLTEIAESSKNPEDCLRDAVRRMRDGTFNEKAGSRRRSRSRSRSTGHRKQAGAHSRPQSLVSGSTPGGNAPRPMTLLERFG